MSMTLLESLIEADAQSVVDEVTAIQRSARCLGDSIPHIVADVMADNMYADREKTWRMALQVLNARERSER